MRQIEGKEGGRQAEVKMVRGRILEQSLWVASIVSTVLPAQALKQRHEVAEADTWDLRPLFATSADWEKDLERLRSYEGVIMQWKGHLAKGEDLLGALEKEKEIDLLAERLGQYASLKVAEDGADGSARDRALRLEFLLTRLSEEMAWFLPELMRIEDDAWGRLLEQPCLVEWKGSLERIRRQRPHILPEGEERLLTLAGPALGGADEIFSQLTNVDFRFGLVRDEDGREVELTHGTFASLLQRRSTEVRRLAWQKYYEEFERHAFSLSATLATSVRTDVFRARARKHPSARDHALFPDRVPGSVVDNLIAVVRKNLGPLQRYHRLRKKVLGLEQLRAADLQVPIVAVAEKKTSFAEAAALVTQATAPLGEEYSATLAQGLGEGRWVDRYENRGKRSGAFSSGSYGSPPYILMNYREDVLADVYTLAHEAGHSMHSWMSQRAQLFQDAHYPIFLAEVASTFNEELLTHAYLEGPAKKDRILRAYILNRQIDDIRGTLYRQVMFAEFEQKIHAAEEKGVALTLDFFRIAYRELLESYLGEVLEIEPPLELECLRIPHFYSAFYVYKYAIGLSAAMTLSQRVLQGEVGAVGKVHEFLSSGGSRPPLETLRRAGVDMESPEPIESALSLFAARVEELEAMLGVAS